MRRQNDLNYADRFLNLKLVAGTGLKIQGLLGTRQELSSGKTAIYRILGV
jgi:hypothetical protein